MVRACLVVFLLASSGCCSTTVKALGLARVTDHRCSLEINDGIRIDWYADDAQISERVSGLVSVRWAPVERDAPEGCPLELDDRVRAVFRLAGSPLGTVVLLEDRADHYFVLHQREGPGTRHGARRAPYSSTVESRPSLLSVVALSVDLLTLPVQLGAFPLTVTYRLLVDDDGPLP